MGRVDAIKRTRCQQLVKVTTFIFFPFFLFSSSDTIKLIHWWIEFKFFFCVKWLKRLSQTRIALEPFSLATNEHRVNKKSRDTYFSTNWLISFRNPSSTSQRNSTVTISTRISIPNWCSNQHTHTHTHKKNPSSKWKIMNDLKINLKKKWHRQR